MKKIWIVMIRARNTVAHEYDEAKAGSVYQEIIKDFEPALSEMYKKLTK